MRRSWWAGAYGAPWTAFGIGRHGRVLEFGELRLAVLSLLDEGPKHGYQIMKEMGERFGGLYSCSAGSVYPILQQLEDEGLVTAKRQGGKRVYRITEAGREELERDPEAVDRIWDRARSCEDWGQFMGPQVVVLMTPLVSTIKATLRAATRAAGKPDREGRIRAILERSSKELEELEKAWSK
jgi:DNA-binding PadR family transcriptional regulator